MKNYVLNDFVLEKKIYINFNGGEALLNKEFLFFATNYFKQNGIENFSLSTNLTILSEDIINFLIDNDIKIQISIDGKKKTHDENRIDLSGKPTFKSVYKNIKLLQRRISKDNLSFNLVFTNKSVFNLYKNVKFLLKKKIYPLSITINSLEVWEKNKFKVLDSEIHKIGLLYEKFYKKKIAVKIKLFNQTIECLVAGMSKYRCGAIKDMIAVLPNSDILVCESFIGDKNYNDYCIGSFKKGIDMQKINYFLRPDFICEEKCNSCSYNENCEHDCFASNRRITGTDCCISPFLCEINKIYLNETYRIMKSLLKNKNFTFIKEYFRGNAK